jgi:hypothetical protein
MTFDLSFCAKRGKSLTWRQMERFLKPLPHMNGDLCTYYNQWTGVYFQFEMEDLDQLDEEYEPPPGFTGAVFHLNYGRPTFFAHEAMEIVGRFCQEFDLLVDNPQCGNAPAKFDREALICSWERSNRWAVKRLFGRKKPPYFPPKQAMYWWRYNWNVPRIDKQIGRKDVWVNAPGLVSHPRRRGEVASLAVWQDDAKGRPRSIVFPRCDYVNLWRSWDPVRQRKRRREQIVRVPYADFLLEVKQFVMPVKADVPHVLFLSNASPRVREVFYGMRDRSIGKAVHDIEPECVVDYRIG